MKIMEIYFGDLNEEAQQTFREIFGEPARREKLAGKFPWGPLLFIYEQEENGVDNDGVGLLNACLVEKERREGK